MPFVKLDCGILDSSLWAEDSDTCKVFLTMLAMCDPEGLCRATAPGISRRAMIPVEKVDKALAILESPDPQSRTTTDEGRRIRRIDGGYFVTNYLFYRERDDTAAERMRRMRLRRKEKGGVTRNEEGVTRNVTQRYGALRKEKEKEKEKEEGENTNTGASAPPRAPSRIFQKPTLEEVRAYVSEIQANVDAQAWYDHYESNGWRVGKNPMKCWKAAVRTWAKNEFRGAAPAEKKKQSFDEKYPPVITQAMIDAQRAGKDGLALCPVKIQRG